MAKQNGTKKSAFVIIKLSETELKKIDERRAETGASRTGCCRALLLKALK